MPILSKSKHEKFSQLVASGEKAGAAYVQTFGATKGAGQSAYRLLKTAYISARVAELKAEISTKLLQNGLRDREFRLDSLEFRYRKLNEVVAERAADPTMAEVPGGKTGFVVRDYKGLGALMPVYKVDTGTLSEFRAIEEQVAREMGQRDQQASAGGVLAQAVQVNVTFVQADQQ